MDIEINKRGIILKGHQPSPVLCAGLSVLVEAYRIQYPTNVVETNGVTRADDLVVVMDNGSEAYKMVADAIRCLDPNEYDINLKEIS